MHQKNNWIQSGKRTKIVSFTCSPFLNNEISGICPSLWMLKLIGTLRWLYYIKTRTVRWKNAKKQPSSLNRPPLQVLPSLRMASANSRFTKNQLYLEKRLQKRLCRTSATKTFPCWGKLKHTTVSAIIFAKDVQLLATYFTYLHIIYGIFATSPRILRDGATLFVLHCDFWWSTGVI